MEGAGEALDFAWSQLCWNSVRSVSIHELPLAQQEDGVQDIEGRAQGAGGTCGCALRPDAEGGSAKRLSW